MQVATLKEQSEQYYLDQFKNCEWCGEPIFRRKGWSEDRWDRVRTCCSECWNLVRRVEARSYLGQYVNLKGIQTSVLREALRPYFVFGNTIGTMDWVLRLLYFPIYYHGKGGGIASDPKFNAMRIGAALHDIDPEMDFGHDAWFDYRMLLVENDNVRPLSPDRGNLSPVAWALKQAGLTAEGLIVWVQSAMESEGPHRLIAERLVRRLCRLWMEYEDTAYSVFVEHGEKKWSRMLSSVVRKSMYADAAVAYSLAEVLAIHRFIVDYRHLMEEVRPEGWRRNNLKSQLKVK